MVCDPPYELSFMSKKWDGTGVAFDPATWEALAEHLHPGGFGMAFASSRGWHRMACAIEDAGLIIHPSIWGWGEKQFLWVYGSGFPKATRVKGSEAFEGHRYGRQALKPSAEPIIVFQKPYEGKPVESIVETGAGALNIDGSRIPGEPWKWGTQTDIRGGGYNTNRVADGDVFKRNVEGHPDGRWPSNFYLGDDEAAARLGEQSGELGTGGPSSSKQSKLSGVVYGSDGLKAPAGAMPKYDRGGTAARFFFNVNRQIDEADPVLYKAKASRKERDAGLDGMAEKARRTFGDMGPDPNARPNGQGDIIARNHHPTVKPIDLTRWLATLLLPPAEYAPRRILVPFSGSGSEMIGAMLAGWEEVVGIEMDLEYVRIARARLAYWASRSEQLGFDL